MEKQNSETLDATATAVTTPAMAPVTDAAAMIAKAEEAAAGIPTEDLIDIRIDPARAAFGVLAARPQIEAVRPELESIFGADGTSSLDALEPAAMAMLKATAAYTADADLELRPQASALMAQRDRMRSVAEAAIERGLVPAAALSRLEGGSSYEALATDTGALSVWVDAHREKLGEHCKVTAEETQQAQLDAVAFGVAVTTRKTTGASKSETSLRRARAFTHLVNVYDLARQLIGYVRWHQGDADRIAPSLYAGRARGTDTRIDGDVEPNPELPAPPVVSPVVGNGEPVIAAPVVTPPVTEPTPPPNPIPPGFPGADPFIRNP